MEKPVKDILPESGIWTIEGLAGYLGLRPGDVYEKLIKLRINVISFSNRYKHKLFRLEDLSESKAATSPVCKNEKTKE